MEVSSYPKMIVCEGRQVPTCLIYPAQERYTNVTERRFQPTFPSPISPPTFFSSTMSDTEKPAAPAEAEKKQVNTLDAEITKYKVCSCKTNHPTYSSRYLPYNTPPTLFFTL